MQAPSVSPYESRLGGSVSFLVVTLNTTGSYNPSCPSSSGLPELSLVLGCGLCICIHRLLGEASLMTVGLGTHLWVQQNSLRSHFIDFFFAIHV